MDFVFFLFYYLEAILNDDFAKFVNKILMKI